MTYHLNGSYIVSAVETASSVKGININLPFSPFETLEAVAAKVS
jgi:hypothetical protein